jgi:hypothetical protein
MLGGGAYERFSPGASELPEGLSTAYPPSATSGRCSLDLLPGCPGRRAPAGPRRSACLGQRRTPFGLHSTHAALIQTVVVSLQVGSVGARR